MPERSDLHLQLAVLEQTPSWNRDAVYRDKRNKLIREGVKAGITRKEVARITGVSVSRVSEIMRNVNVMPTFAKAESAGRNACFPNALYSVGLYESPEVALVAVNNLQDRPVSKVGSKWHSVRAIFDEHGWDMRTSEEYETFFRAAQRYERAILFSRGHAAAVVDHQLVDTHDTRRRMARLVGIPA